MPVATSTWNNLANGSRWGGIVAFIRNWVGPFDSSLGMAPDELDVILRAKAMDLPAAVREWYVLAANWDQGGLNAWIRPRELAVQDAMIGIMTDTEGVNCWRVRIADLGIDDPPIVCSEENPDSIVFPNFSGFVAAMIINDVLFAGEAQEGLIELNRDPARDALTRLVPSLYGDFFVDAPLGSATIVMFAYPRNGPVYGKSRTPAGCEILQRFRNEHDA